MSTLQLTVIFLLLLCGLQTILASLKQLSFYRIDKHAGHWQSIQHMQCTHRPIQNGVHGIWKCILESTYDAESFMVGTNASHCILCYYQVNGATLNASEFQGTLLFKRGKLHPLLLPSEWCNIEGRGIPRDSPC